MAHDLGDKIEWHLLGTPILLTASIGLVEAKTPEQLREFDEALGKMFGIKLDSDGPRPRCCCCYTEDHIAGTRVDDCCCC